MRHASTTAEAGLRRGVARLAPAVPLLLGLAGFARAVAAGDSLLNDPDTYLHIAAGRWILAHAALPAHDPFSQSLPGAPWVVHEWLAECVLAAVHDALGWAGLVLLTAGCFALALALLARHLLPKLGPLPTLVAVSLSAALILPHLLARPHLLALPLLVIWSAALIEARDRGQAPPFRFLPVMTLWANLHGGFMVGLALAGLAALEAVLDRSSRQRALEARRWGAFVLAAAGAAMLTPNGLAGLRLPFHLLAMTSLQDSFVEWLSPDFHGFQPLEVWLLALPLLGFSLGVRLPVSRLLLLLALVHLALHQARQGELLALVGPLAVAAALGAQLPAPLRGAAASEGRPSGAIVVLLVGLGLAIAGLTLRQPWQRTDDRVTPASAVAAARRMGLSGPVLNSEPFGGYLIFRGIPTFIDGRMEMYGDAFLRRYLAATTGNEPALVGLLQDHAIRWTLLEPTSRAVDALDHLAGWRRVYDDAYAVIHVRVEDGAEKPAAGR